MSEKASARMPIREEPGALSMPPGAVIEGLHTGVDAEKGQFEVTQFPRLD